MVSALLKLLMINFNSIKVRLERVPVTVFVTIPYLFQFHKGTIRTYSCPCS